MAVENSKNIGKKTDQNLKFNCSEWNADPMYMYNIKYIIYYYYYILQRGEEYYYVNPYNKYNSNGL